MTDKTEETAVVVQDNSQPPAQVGIFEMPPAKRVEFASEMAAILKGVIEKQQLYADIKGKKHITVEGWTTLGALLGIVPRESSTIRLEDGSYEARVDLLRSADGTIVGGASAICSVNERQWKNADDNARRSMAITRATGKAYRLGYSWISALAGYAVTPAEEMPARDITQELHYTGTKSQREELKKICKDELSITDNATLRKISDEMIVKKVLLKDLPSNIGEFVATH